MATMENSIINVPTGSEQVTDADEEIFLLYSRLSGHPTSASDEMLGLGSVDSKTSNVTIKFEIDPPILANEPPDSPCTSRPTHRSRKKLSSGTQKPETREYVLQQDPTSLRSRQGDTGSVLWRASVQFGRCILSDLLFPPGDSSTPLFLRSGLRHARVLELGSGIGLLAAILIPHVAHYIATDIPALLPLLRKNLFSESASRAGSSGITVTDINWEDLYHAPSSLRNTAFPHQGVDLILCCDCIYNTALVPPLIATINHYAKPRAPVVIVAELRQEDVLRLFFEMWLSSGDWEIWRVGPERFGVRTVVWVGWLRS